MRVVGRKMFWNTVQDLEKVFMINKKRNEYMLMSDMEYSEYAIKIEKMAFMLPGNMRMEEAVTECRSYYCGGIIIDKVAGLSVEETISLFESSFENVRYAFMKGDAVCRNELGQGMPDGIYCVRLY